MPGTTLHVVGIRHHSPACARLVAQVIERVRPAHVLIEGPADMNERIEELHLPHRLPIAVFTYLRSEVAAPGGDAPETRQHTSWTPFCSYSPEWLALTEGRRVGAEVRFCDLPAWDRAFSGTKNRYADHAPADPNAGLVAGRAMGARYGEALARHYGVDDIDTLWDHLFEGPLDTEVLEERLETYFQHLRNDEPGGPRDAPREALMARFCAWAMRDAEGAGRRDVVLVCGGFHAPYVKRRALELYEASVREGSQLTLPVVDPPEAGARHGSYLVPYSYKRLDAFAGYDAGMPSPGFYEIAFSEGPERAGERLLELVVARLRGKKQLASTADLIAARTLAEALAAMRGHPALLRTDLLDGLASALLKDGLDVPLPWARRGPLLPRTDPLLVEVVAALSGEREGKLAPKTPLPPLVRDVDEELERHELVASTEPRVVKLSLRTEAGRAKSRILHRLLVLAVPGFLRASGPGWATDGTLDEVWKLHRVDDRLSPLIEASIWGATLEAAALGRLEDALLQASGKLRALTEILGSAVFVGIGGLANDVIGRVESALSNEHVLSDVGYAIGRLLDVYLHGDLLGGEGAVAIERVLVASLDRGLWLLEGRMGPTVPLDQGEVNAVAALRDLLLRGPAFVASQRVRAEGVFARRSLDPQAPPAIRGASLGALWSLAQGSESQEREALAVSSTRSASLPTTLGDFLGGLFGVARREALHAEGLFSAIDEALVSLGDQELLAALPSLRLAFTYFPPRERAVIAERVLRKRGVQGGVQALLRLEVTPGDVAAGLALDAAARALAKRFALGDALDGEEASDA